MASSDAGRVLNDMLLKFWNDTWNFPLPSLFYANLWLKNKKNVMYISLVSLDISGKLLPQCFAYFASLFICTQIS